MYKYVKDLFTTNVIETHGTYGFFHALVNRVNAQTYPIYTQEQGNPILIWGDISDDEPPIYRGILYTNLDMLYIMRSGDKLLTKFVRENAKKRYDLDGQVEVFIFNLVISITRKYSKKWLSLWETMFYEYNPIENYNMEEVLTDQVTEFEHGHIEELLNGRINTRTGDVKETPGVTITETEGIQGFDSTNFKNANQNTTSPSGFNKTEYEQLKDTLSGTDKTTHSGTDTETKNYTLTRAGNIGVTTSQQMIEQERKLLMFDYFDKIVFPDIDKELTLQVY